MMKNPYEDWEEEIMNHLKRAWELFQILDETHPCHGKDFSDGLHKCQDVIIHRIVQRDYPEHFPTFEKERSYY